MILCRGQRGIDTPLILSLENPRFLCRPRTKIVPELLKASLNVVEAAEQVLDHPRGPNEMEKCSNRLVHTPRSGRPDVEGKTGRPNSCLPPPPSRRWCSEGRQWIRSGASLCGCATYSSRLSCAQILEAADSIGVTRFLCRILDMDFGEFVFPALG